jgi:hypothetical protein
MALAPGDNVGFVMTLAPGFVGGEDEPHATQMATTTLRRIRTGNLTTETLAVPAPLSRL